MTPARLVYASILLILPAAAPGAGQSSDRDAEVPFCYLCGGTRQWSLSSAPLHSGRGVDLTAWRDGNVLARGIDGKLEVQGTQVRITPAGRLQVTRPAKDPGPAFELEIIPERGESRRVSLRAAPPVSPVTYYADFGDDLINIFGAGVGGQDDLLHHELRDPRDPTRAARRFPRDASGRLRYDKAGFDQYFRRLQCQGIDSEILWLFPGPFLAGPEAYAAADWKRFDVQAGAIAASTDLRRIAEDSKGHVSWAWLQDLYAFRADRKAHCALSDSAVEHGVKLAVSFRPFEPAVTKYYELAVFDDAGNFLWDFLPLASPAVNARFAELGFAHYRELLARMNRPADADTDTLELAEVDNAGEFLARYRAAGDNLRVLASGYPPMQLDSFVLQRQRGGSFRLRRFGEIAGTADARRLEITGFQIRQEGGRLILSGLRIPREARYLLLENPSGHAPLRLRAHAPARLRSPAGAPLGRTNVYWSFADESSPERKQTRVAGMTAAAGLHPVFFASEAAASYLAEAERQPLAGATLVIERGGLYSPEMVDYQLPAARALAVRELRAVLAYPAFREIYVNTRSHTQLAGDLGDGDAGIRPKIEYRTRKKPVRHLGIDLAYAPRGTARNPVLRGIDSSGIADWKPGEWTGACQTPECPSYWRYARNQEVAAGIRMLLRDLESSFPHHRLRVVVPERRPAAELVAREIQPGAVPYTASRNNHLPNIGEGMTMVDLSGLRAEPVLLGVGPFVDPRILGRYLEAAPKELPGAAALMYEGQWTLKDDAGRRAREQRVCQMLSRPEISEVIVYEAADWAYRLPWDGWQFLDRCAEILRYGAK